MKIVLLGKNNELVKEIERGQHEVFDLVEYWDKFGNHNYYKPRNISEDTDTVFCKAVSRIARIDERPPKSQVARPPSYVPPNTA